MPVQHVLQHIKSTCAKILIFSLTPSGLGFPLLSIFHPLVVKFFQVYNYNYELKLHGHRKIENFNLGEFLLKVSLMTPPFHCAAMVILWYT
jgi:hypothetical protein